MTKEIILLVVAIIFNAGANILLKLGMKDAAALLDKGPVEMVFRAVTNVYVILGLGSFGLAFVAYSLVLSKLRLSIAYPLMTSVGFVIVTIAAVFIFSESITLLKLTGIAVIALGIWMVAVL